MVKKKVYLFFSTVVLLILFSGMLLSKTLTFVTQYEPVFLSPYKAIDLHSWQIMRNVYETLVYCDCIRAKIEPLLAEKWKIENNGKTYVFWLKKGILFHNGDELTSSDVLFSFKRLKEENPYLFSMLFSSPDVRAVSKYKVSFELKKRFTPFLRNLSSVFGSVVSDKSGTNKLIGSGPYSIKPINSTKIIILKRFEKYWGKKPFFSTIRIRIVKEPKRRIELLKTGKADISTIEYYDELGEISHSKNLTIKKMPLRGGYFLFLNTKKEPFSSPKNRHFFYTLIKRKPLVKKVFSILAKPKMGIFESTIADDLFLPKVQLSTKKRWKITGIVKKEDQGAVKFLSILKMYLKKRGIELEFQAMPFKELILNLENFKTDFVFLGWSGFSCDPDAFFTPLFEKTSPLEKFIGYENKTVSELIRKGREADEEEREEVYRKIEKILLKESPIIPLYQKVNAISYRGDLKNVELTKEGRICFGKIVVKR